MGCRFMLGYLSRLFLVVFVMRGAHFSPYFAALNSFGPRFD
ncbi:hypothetical protein EBME_1599 [bacterium endosymbiont of Mortierella elongata FMR23-6]|nr:hypothetical protein EBME_1599 [bacterium endosymbiont of Mortierella elongata FMR23-6]